MKNNIHRRMQMTLRFYNRLTDSDLENITQIPKEKLAFLMKIPYEAMATPFIVEENGKGKGRYHLGDKYDLPTGKVRQIIR